MKNITCEFRNIQSHEHTRFTLGPGLNFILADDNNVGKSTIFKVFIFALQMPRFSNKDALELLRVGSNQGYAAFLYDDLRVVLWFFREPENKIRVFFETAKQDINGEYSTVSRTMECPLSLSKALDIVRDTNGDPINFNDADSVQLIVEDTSRNDQVLCQVLVDMRVENIRDNSQRLARQVTQDYRLVRAQYEDTTRVLDSITYNHAVDDFNKEKEMLYALVRVTDLISTECAISNESITSIGFRDSELLYSMVKVLSILDECKFTQQETEVPSIREFARLSSCLEVLRLLFSFDETKIEERQTFSLVQLQNAQKALQVLDSISLAFSCMGKVNYEIQKIKRYTAQVEEIKITLAKTHRTVECPVKGSVYFSEQECIPTGF